MGKRWRQALWRLGLAVFFFAGFASAWRFSPQINWLALTITDRVDRSAFKEPTCDFTEDDTSCTLQQDTFEDYRGQEGLKVDFGKDTNFELVRNLDSGSAPYQFSLGVGRFDFRLESGVWKACTAFLISHTYLLTAGHCVKDEKNQWKPIEEARLVLGYLGDEQSKASELRPGDSPPEGIVELKVHLGGPCSPDAFGTAGGQRHPDTAAHYRKAEGFQGLDYALLVLCDGEFDRKVTQAEDPANRRFHPLDIAGIPLAPDHELVVIHHPMADRLILTRRYCKAVGQTRDSDPFPLRFRHKCDTLGGSSGAPVFSRRHEMVLAIHVCCGFYKGDSAEQALTNFNEAISIAAIAKDNEIVRKLMKRDVLSTEQRQRVADAQTRAEEASRALAAGQAKLAAFLAYDSIHQLSIREDAKALMSHVGPLKATLLHALSSLREIVTIGPVHDAVMAYHNRDASRIVTVGGRWPEPGADPTKAVIEMRVWDGANGKPIAGPIRIGGQRVEGAAFDKRDDVFALGTCDRIEFFNTDSWETLGRPIELNLGYGNCSLKFSEDGTRVAVTTYDDDAKIFTIKLFEIATHKAIDAQIRFRAAWSESDDDPYDEYNRYDPYSHFFWPPVELSLDGARLATYTGDLDHGVLRIWNIKSSDPLGSQKELNISTYESPQFAFSKNDGGVRLVISTSVEVLVWNTQEGKLEEDATFSYGDVSSQNYVHARDIYFDPNGRILIGFASSNNGVAQKPPDDFNPNVSSRLNPAPDPESLSESSGRGDTLHIFDLLAKREIVSPISAPQGVSAIKFIRNGSRVLTLAPSGLVRQWSTYDRLEIGRSFDAGVVGAWWSEPDVLADGEKLFTFEAGVAQLWRLDQAAPDASIYFRETSYLPPNTSDFGGDPEVQSSADGRVIAVLPSNYDPWRPGGLRPNWTAHASISIIDARRSDEPFDIVSSRKQEIRRFALSADGERLALSLHGGSLELWDVRRRRLIRTLIEGVSADVSGSPIAGAGGGSTSEGVSSAYPAFSSFTFIAFSRDSTRFAAVAGDEMYLWDASNGKRLKQVEDAERLSNVVSVALGERDGFHRILTVGALMEGSVLAGWSARIWDGETLRLIAEEPMPTANGNSQSWRGPVRYVFSPDGMRIAKMTVNYDWVLLEVEGETLRPTGQRMQAGWNINFSPDSSSILASSDDGAVEFWDGRDGRPIGPPLQLNRAIYNTAIWQGDEGTIFAIASAPPGSTDTVATPAPWQSDPAATAEVTIREPKSGMVLAELTTKGGAPTLEFSDDGKSLIIITQSQGILVWKLPTWSDREVLDEAKKRLARLKIGDPATCQLDYDIPCALAEPDASGDAPQTSNKRPPASNEKTVSAPSAASSLPPDAASGDDLSAIDPDFNKNIREGKFSTGPKPEIVGANGRVPPGAHLETVLIDGGDTLMRETCTGVLIAPNVVLSARHCGQLDLAEADAPIRIIDDGSATPLFSARAADVEYSDVDSEKAITEQKFKTTDLMLIRLAAPLKDIRPAIIASSRDIDAARFGKIVGYGFSERSQEETTSRGAQRKLEGDVNVVSQRCDGPAFYKDQSTTEPILYGCQKGLELVAGHINGVDALCSIKKSVDTCIATMKESGDTESEAKSKCSYESIIHREHDGATMDPQICTDTCSGDSGGPLFVAPRSQAGDWTQYKAAVDSSNDPRYRLAAITSRSVGGFVQPHRTLIEGKPCGDGGVYALLDGANVEWINKTFRKWGLEPPAIPDDAGVDQLAADQ